VDRRLIVAIVLIVMTFLIQTYWVRPYLERTSRENLAKQAQPPPVGEIKPAPVEKVPLEKKANSVKRQPEVAQQERIIEEEIKVENKFLRLVFTNRGAALKEAVLKEYTDSPGGDELVLLKPFVEGRYSLVLRDRDGEYDLENSIYEVTKTPAGLLFRLPLEGGLVIEKGFFWEDDSYALKMTLRVVNETGPAKELSLSLLGPAGISSEQRRAQGAFGSDVKALSGVGRAGYSFKFKREVGFKVGQEKHLQDMTFPVFIAGLENQYFAAAFSSSDAESFEATYALPLLDEKELELVLGRLESSLPEKELTRLRQRFIRNISVRADLKPLRVEPGGEWKTELLFFVGPKDRRVLSRYAGYEQLVNYGWFAPLSLLLLGLLKIFYRVIPNYGVAIIVLTGLIRLLMHPLARRSQASIQKMQKMRPKILELQKRYKNNPQRFREEQMKLMREHGASPFGGCLVPMLIQFPVFIAMYRLLAVSIEMRQAPFVLWIKDLSQPDVLLSLPFTIPFLGTNALSLLPILMTAVMVIQQLKAPKPEDPQARSQAKMMIMMPVFFGFILYRFAAGLNLYWLVSSLFGVFEQHFIRKALEKSER